MSVWWSSSDSWFLVECVLFRLRACLPCYLPILDSGTYAVVNASGRKTTRVSQKTTIIVSVRAINATKLSNEEATAVSLDIVDAAKKMFRPAV